VIYTNSYIWFTYLLADFMPCQHSQHVLLLAAIAQLSKVMLAYIIGELGTFYIVVLNVSSGTCLTIIIKIG